MKMPDPFKQHPSFECRSFLFTSGTLVPLNPVESSPSASINGFMSATRSVMTSDTPVTKKTTTAFKGRRCHRHPSHMLFKSTAVLPPVRHTFDIRGVTKSYLAFEKQFYGVRDLYKQSLVMRATGQRILVPKLRRASKQRCKIDDYRAAALVSGSRRCNSMRTSRPRHGDWGISRPSSEESEVLDEFTLALLKGLNRREL